MDVEAEGRMALALRAVVLRVCGRAGPEAAHDVVETLNANSPRQIHWLAPNEVPHVPGRDLRAEVDAHMGTGEPVWAYWPDPKTGEPIRYLYIPIAHRGRPLAVIEASESMAP